MIRGGRLAVLGGSALARSLATEPGAVLLDRVVHPGSWLSRRVDPDTGAGIRAALLGVDRLVVHLEGAAEHLGLYVVLRPDETRRRVVIVTPPGTPAPAWTAAWPAWSTLALGYAWGPGDALHDAVVGARTCPDPGPIPVVPLHEARAAVLAALDHPGARWTWNGTPATLPSLAGGSPGRPWMTARWARRAGVAWLDVAQWVGRPGGARHTPGWDPETDEITSPGAVAPLVGGSGGA